MVQAFFYEREGAREKGREGAREAGDSVARFMESGVTLTEEQLRLCCDTGAVLSRERCTTEPEYF